jgi:hypothetical protein
MQPPSILFTEKIWHGRFLPCSFLRNVSRERKHISNQAPMLPPAKLTWCVGNATSVHTVYRWTQHQIPTCNLISQKFWCISMKIWHGRFLPCSFLRNVGRERKHISNQAPMLPPAKLRRSLQYLYHVIVSCNLISHPLFSFQIFLKKI